MCGWGLGFKSLSATASIRFMLRPYLIPTWVLHVALWTTGSSQFSVFLGLLAFVCCVAYSVGLLIDAPKVKDYLCASMDQKEKCSVYHKILFFWVYWGTQAPPPLFFMIIYSLDTALQKLRHACRLFWAGLQIFLCVPSHLVGSMDQRWNTFSSIDENCFAKSCLMKPCVFIQV